MQRKATKACAGARVLAVARRLEGPADYILGPAGSPLLPVLACLPARPPQSVCLAEIDEVDLDGVQAESQ